MPQVISKEANFVTVRLDDSEEPPSSMPGPTDLLCNVRALLKKIKQTVLVGDHVQVDSIDWADKRGQHCHLYICRMLGTLMLNFSQSY